ncbi:hypothetical protein F4802DRAFT_595706 [Xylaria palmicola]|nr:hypothetical protein F4802DRAFT_595706 [Xylaria palmicola]
MTYRAHRRDSDGSNFSPPGSPPMSLFSDMSPLSPVRRPFSPSLAPSSPLYPRSESDPPGPDHDDRGDIALGGRDSLVQRLNDLAARLSGQQHVQDESMDVLHAKVDELENALHASGYSSQTDTRLPPSSRKDENQDSSNISLKQYHLDHMVLSDLSSLAPPMPPSSPIKTTKVRHQDHTKAELPSSKMTAAQVERIVEEAQTLHKNLEVVISNLRDRQEETEHIHTLLITRLERAAQHIIQLEDQLADLGIQRKEDEKELLNLQIQLKAIEVQCLNYVPEGADQGLRESIDTWRMEWSAMKQRKARNREQFNGTPTRRGAE